MVVIADYHFFSKNVPNNEEIVPKLVICPHCGHKEEITDEKE